MNAGQTGKGRHGQTRGTQDFTHASRRLQQGLFQHRPLYQAVVLCVLAAAAGHATAGVNLSHIGRSMSSAGSANLGVGGSVIGGSSNLAQPQPSQQSVANLGHVAAALSAQIAAQQAAAAAVAGTTSSVPNGLAAGGLQVLAGGTWSNALAPTQSTANGQTTVTVQQTAPQAVLDWNTFNIGRQTTLDFNQQGNTSWAVLNRIFDPTGVPSQILGAIKADGLVIVENRNGVIFAAGSQVNLGSLVATSAMIDPTQFLATGIYSAQSGSTYTPSFTNAGGAILVAPGAQISTNIPGSVTQGGGYVLLMGSSVQNAGSIATPDGQTTLAAGDNFLIRPGFSTTGNATSTTIGNEVATQDNAGSASGTVSNTGLIESTTGDITMVGHNVTQGGVALSTTSVSTRGTIHLLNSASDTTGSITLTPDSVTSITDDPNSGTALDSQRAALLGDGPTGSETENAARLTNPIAPGSSFDDLSNLADLEDESRVEIVTGGTVEFQGNSLTLATGGQIAVSAVQRVQVDTGALLDVSGSNIELPMSANQLTVNIQGAELADSPGNRDSDDLNNGNVFVDIQNLSFVPANTGGDANARDYTAGGLLEVSGELSDVDHTIGEWTASGGNITLSTGATGSVVAQTGSNFNISGGSIQYQSGMLSQSWLLGVDGRIYNVNTAPSAIQYVGPYNGFIESHPRWGVTIDWHNPLIAPSQILEAGYTVGKDAGSLILSTPTSIFEGDVEAGVVVGQNQQGVRPATITDPYLLSQTTAPLAGTLELGQYGPEGLQNVYTTDVRFDNAPAAVADSIGVNDVVPTSRVDTAWFDANSLSSYGLGGLSVATDGSIEVNAPLLLAAGGQFNLFGPTVDIAAALTAHGGGASIGNVATVTSVPGLTGLTDVNGAASVTLEGTGSIDTSGLFTNALLDPNDLSGEAFINGGDVAITSTQGIDLAAGSVIDTSSGGTIQASGKTVGGTGGSVTLAAADEAPANAIGGASTNAQGDVALVLAGTLRAFGVNGGGALSLTAPSVWIGDAASSTPADALVLPGSFFTQGFSSYDITGDDGVTVAPGAQIVVTEPVYEFAPASRTAPTGTAAASALQAVLLPVYTANPVNDTITQRQGASLTLNGLSALQSSGSINDGGPLTVGAGSLIAVDPGQSIALNANRQITVDGTLQAPGGAISIVNNRGVGGANSTTNDPDGLSIWIGGDATLDVAAQAFTATDTAGRLFGVVPNGGSITLGTANTGFNSSDGTILSSDAFIIVRPGALLDASGTSAALDPTLGGGGVSNLALANFASTVDTQSTDAASLVASNGGSILLNSDLGIYADGTLRAAAGGAGAAGGSLSVILATPDYQTQTLDRQHAVTTPDSVRVPRVITISQTASASTLSPALQAGEADPSLAAGQAQFSVDGLTAGGFGNLSFTASDAIVFNGNVNLKAQQSIALNQGAISDTSPSAQVTISAPTVLISGNTGVVPGGIYPTIDGAFSNQVSTGTLSVDADLIELSNLITFGVAGSEQQEDGSSVNYDFAGFGEVNFVSQGDVRFLGGTAIKSAQNLSFTAAQLFPVSNAVVTVSAGLIAQNSDVTDLSTTGEIDIHRIDDVDPAMPDSLFGNISFDAGTVNQGGIVRAPLGLVSLDTDSFDKGTSGTVNLLPGSITSVSANGLDIPYGGTADGTSYTQNNATVNGFVLVGSQLGPTITLSGSSVNVAPGATIDLSGGGTVAGAGFVAGSGGSVNVLGTPLVNANPANGAYSSATNQVYAIIPGFAGYAPIAPGEGTAPGIGQQITIPAGVPGLPAGTYTLLPADYALLPGGYRVELGKTGQNASSQALALGNGSYEVGGHTAVANTGIVDALPTNVIVTPAATVLTYSQYNQTNLSDFLTAQASTLGQTPPIIAADAGLLNLVLAPNQGQSSLSFQGTALFAPATGGQPGTVEVTGSGDFEIYGTAPTPGFAGVSVGVGDLNAMGAPRLVIGGTEGLVQGVYQSRASASNLNVDPGVDLSGSEIFLLATNDITLGAGAEIDTLGGGAPPDTSAFIYNAMGNTVLAASNGNLNFTGLSSSSGAITLDAGATILSKGTIAIATAGAVNIDDTVHLGTQDLNLDVGTINIGSVPGAVVPTGYTLTQAELDTLLGGDAALGIPAVQMLTLSAANSINFFGSVDLNVSAASGNPDATVVLNTPAIYGYGGASDSASLTVGTLIWNGVENTGASPVTSVLPAGVVTGGPGTGTGTLTLNANEVVFGFAPNTVPNDQVTLDRVAEGFSSVNIDAGEITANNKGTLSVYQGTGATNGTPGTGGTLNLNTPLLTAASGAVMGYTAGGALNVSLPSGMSASTAASTDLGGEIDLTGNTVSVASAVVLPSGKLDIAADGDITLAPTSLLNLSGQAVPLFDQTSYTPGGTVILQSTGGSITQDAGATINVSAANANAGSVTASAAQGAAEFDGAILGNVGGNSAADFEGGQFAVSGQTIGDFAALNMMLDAGGVFGARSFDVKQGDLTIGDGVQAQSVTVSVDNGSLTVNGLIDASGVAPGSISLSAKDNLTIASGASLDTHSTVLHTDSYGVPVDAENQGTVSLTATTGQLALQPGATIDLSTPDGVARGDIELNAPRVSTDDIDISAAGPLSIAGAATIAVNGFRTYTNAPEAPDATAADPDQLITQAYLDTINMDSQAFINAAETNADLQSRLAGLTAFGAAYHLRPGVEIDSATPNGDLTVSGDINLAGYRYGPGVNPAVYGSGEPGVLILRAGGNLNVNGSISDGFGTPPATPDDNGWQLLPGTTLASNLDAPESITLIGNASGTATTFSTSAGALSYAIPIRATNLNANTVVPIAVTTAGAVTLANSYVTTASIQEPDGTVIARGTILPAGTVVPAGSILGAGTVWPSTVSITAMTVPAGTPLGIFSSVVLAANVTVTTGQIIPSGTKVQLAVISGSQSTPLTLTAPLTVSSGTVLVGGSTLILPEAVSISAAKVQRNVPIPFAFASGAAFTIASSFAASADISNASGTVLFAAGQTVPANTTFPSGTHFAAGTIIPVSNGATAVTIAAMTLPAGTSLAVFSGNVTLKGSETFAAGETIPQGSNSINADPDLALRPSGTGGTQGQIGAIAPMLPAGDLSWSISLVAGADTTAADTDILQSATALDGSGNLELSDLHFGNGSALNVPSFSVLRTGTGDLSLSAGGNIDEDSQFGVYTAGTQSPTPAGADAASFNLPQGTSQQGTSLGGANAAGYQAADAGYQAYYPDNGGDVAIQAQGNLGGYFAAGVTVANVPGTTEDSNAIGNWLFRQGGSVVDQATAWWINFGTYTAQGGGLSVLTGFTGIGTLGGGNIAIKVGGNAGAGATAGAASDTALSATVASTGRVTPSGTLDQTGGGDLNVSIGGTLNSVDTNADGNAPNDAQQGGVFTDLRGNIMLSAQSIGDIVLSYGVSNQFDPRTPSPLTPGVVNSVSVPTNGAVFGGIVVVPGDGTVNVSTRGDLVLAGVEDAGRIDTVQNQTPYTSGGVSFNGGGQTDFTLWTDASAINLNSLGGNLSPNGSFSDNAAGVDFFPPTLNVTAETGNIVLVPYSQSSNNSPSVIPLELAPAPDGQLTLLAAGSIFGDNSVVDISGADPTTEATPFNPAFEGSEAAGTFGGTGASVSNVSANSLGFGSLLPFGPDTPTTNLHQNDSSSALIYAVNGDITDLEFGQVLNFDPVKAPGVTTQTWYVGAKSAVIHAGGDIVSSGDPADFPEGTAIFGATSVGDFILNANPSDVSVVQAGQDIIFSSYEIGGPGLLDVEAGRNYYAGNHGTLTSVGPVFDITQASRSSGAGITVMAGVGANGPDYTQFANLYFNPANQGSYDQTLTDPDGTVLDTYNGQLFNWLQSRFGYTGMQADALNFFLALPTQQQGVFVRQAYFEELNASGLDFNDPTAPDFKSYARGQQAIATLFPTTSANGTPITYRGDITMFSGEVSFDGASGHIQATLAPPGAGGIPEKPSDSGITTVAGGTIQTLTPGGETLVGVTGGTKPGPDAGVLTQGSGDIDMYADQSILLGQSRILTTFGGGIVAWSAEGDINGGEGAKTTVIIPPPSLTYTDDGEITLSPTVPSTGAGIGTLSPISEVPPGDINLVTPLGTVNAGEAGIRVSGNLNVAALHVVNAANIQVQGKSTGVPVTATVDTGALTAASSAASAVTQMAQSIVRNNANGVASRHWIITVQVEGFGDDSNSDADKRKRKPESVSYNTNSPLQVVGHGSLSPQALTSMAERVHLSGVEIRSIQQDQ